MYKTYADLRDMLLHLSLNLSCSPEAESVSAREFERLLYVAHYLATRAACDGTKQLSEVSSKITVSLLRYTDVVPADRAFLEAGNRAKVSEERIQPHSECRLLCLPNHCRNKDGKT